MNRGDRVDSITALCAMPCGEALSARVTGWLAATPVDIAVWVDAARGWTINGWSCPDLDGCDDINLSFSPATNLLPIRRIRLATGAQASAARRVASISGPDVGVA